MSGFVDLRLNRRHSTDEGFWPSFTDIMTVVVMIFLMGLVIVLLKHMELTANLRAALEAEKKATALALTTSAEKSRVSTRLSEAEEELSRLRMQVLLANDQRQAMQEQLQRTRQELQQSSERNDSLQRDNETLSRDMDQLASRLDDEARQRAELQQRYQQLTESTASLSSELERSRELQETTARELASAREMVTSSDAELAEIRGEFSDLQVKYNKLIKPARTSKGKFIAEVQYSKASGRAVYRIKEGPQAEALPVSYQELNNRLQKLKDKHGSNLYIRLIFPENSKLSFNDAWTFSKEILNKYDYYHQQ
jgi:chromosome segregation ATPase